MTKQIHNFSGDLATDCRGVFQSLSKSFDKSSLSRISEIYHELLPDALKFDLSLKRTPGINFAPRHIRAVSILTKESRDFSFSMVLAAMALSIEEFSPEKSAWIVNNAPLETSDISLLRAIALLDSARHLHMMDKAQILKIQYERTFLELKSTIVSQRVANLIQAAFERYERFNFKESCVS